MSEVEANATHYMNFPHTVSGNTRDDFTITLIKNGEVIKNIAFEVREVATNIYTISFVNDGTDFSTWTMIVADPEVPDIYFIESWEVRRRTIEKTVIQTRARQDSKGGFYRTERT